MRLVVEPKLVEVPEGHEVCAVGGSLLPSVRRLDGGLLVASTGVAGDDHLAEVSELLSEIERRWPVIRRRASVGRASEQRHERSDGEVGRDRRSLSPS
jgi:hypothetical protein